MAGYNRGGKRENAGRPKGEPTKMTRVPESIHEDVMRVIKAHKEGRDINIDLGIQESKESSSLHPDIEEFFTLFPEHQYSDHAVNIAVYFDAYHQTVKHLPRHQRQVISKLLKPKKPKKSSAR